MINSLKWVKLGFDGLSVKWRLGYEWGFYTVFPIENHSILTEKIKDRETITILDPNHETSI